jgi:hypothetical protein
MPKEELLIAQFLVLIIGKLTGWNAPTPKGGDPVYLNADQASALAVSGISLLASFLPQQSAQQVEAAVERLPRHHHAAVEDMLLSVGRLGGVRPPSVDGPPGCCFEMNGHLVCVR